MAALLLVARGLLWLQTIFYLLGSMGFLLAPRGMTFTYAAIITGIALTGFTGLVANLLWRSRPVLSRRLAIAASIPTLLLIPIGTLFGSLQLLVFIRHRAASAPAAKKMAEPIRKRIQRWAGILLAMGLIGLCNIFVLESLKARHALLSMWVLLLIPPIALVATAIHEAGHLWFGVRNRLRADLYMVGPFCWIRLADGWKFAFLPKAYPIGGRAGTTPLDSHQPARHLAWMILGGPLTEAAAGLVFLATFLSMDAARSPWLAHAAGFAAALCLSGLGNMVPFSTGHSQTDGALLLDLWRGRHHRAAVEARWLVGLPHSTVIRFREIDPGPIVDPASHRFVSWSLARYYQALDQGQIASAGQWLDAAVASQVTAPARANDRICAWEAAWFAATHRGDAEARSRLPRKLHGLPIDRFVTLRAEAALCRIEGRSEEALANVREAQRLLDRCTQTGWTALNRELLESVPANDLDTLRQAIEMEREENTILHTGLSEAL